MIPRSLLCCCLACAATFSAGCLFSKKNKPKENSAIATEVEASFKRRWIDQRVAQLVAQGLAAGAAQAQAAREFDERYDFNGAPKK